MRNRLTLSYRYDGTPTAINDDFGRLEMIVQTETRWGTGGFWVQWQDLHDLAARLSEFPIEPDRPINAQWGYVEDDRSETVLKIEISPANATGALSVRARIADEYDPADHLEAVFEAHYPDLSRFQQQILEMMKGEVSEAILCGS